MVLIQLQRCGIVRCCRPGGRRGPRDQNAMPCLALPGCRRVRIALGTRRWRFRRVAASRGRGVTCPARTRPQPRQGGHHAS